MKTPSLPLPMRHDFATVLHTRDGRTAYVAHGVDAAALYAARLAERSGLPLARVRAFLLGCASADEATKARAALRAAGWLDRSPHATLLGWAERAVA